MDESTSKLKLPKETVKIINENGGFLTDANGNVQLFGTLSSCTIVDGKVKMNTHWTVKDKKGIIHDIIQE